MRRQVQFGTMALVAMLFTMMAFATPASAAGVTVHPGESIQAAIDAAGPGTTITVKSGTYAENLLITKDNITIVGQGAILIPPANAFKTPCSGAPHPVGFCVVGDPNTNKPVSRDEITGFTVRN